MLHDDKDVAFCFQADKVKFLYFEGFFSFIGLDAS